MRIVTDLLVWIPGLFGYECKEMAFKHTKIDFVLGLGSGPVFSSSP